MPLREQFRVQLHDKFVYYRQLHFADDKLEAALVKAGINEAELLALRTFLAGERKKQKRKAGAALIITGSALLVAGFIWTALLYHQNSPVEGVMYGFTVAGIVLIIGGVCLLF